MEYSLIEKLREDKKVLQKDFVKKIGMSPNGYNKMLKEESLKVETLEKIARYFNVSPCYFFGCEGDKGDVLVNEPDAIYNNKLPEKNDHDVINHKLDNIWEELRDFLRHNNNMANLVLELVTEQRKFKDALDDYHKLLKEKWQKNGNK